MKVTVCELDNRAERITPARAAKSTYPRYVEE